MTLQLKLTIEWTDSRHEYIDLKTDENMNSLSTAEMNDIWMPTLVFENTRDRQQADFRNKSTFSIIKINPSKYMLHISLIIQSYLPLCIFLNLVLFG